MDIGDGIFPAPVLQKDNLYLLNSIKNIQVAEIDGKLYFLVGFKQLPVKRLLYFGFDGGFIIRDQYTPGKQEVGGIAIGKNLEQVIYQTGWNTTAFNQNNR